MEHLSIMLEIIAFFFVTIDLYGRERLEKLRDKVIKIKIGRIHELVKKSVTFKVISYLIAISIILCMVWYVQTIYGMYMCVLKINNTIVVNLCNVSIVLVLIYLIIGIATCIMAYIRTGDTLLIEKLFLNSIIRKLITLLLYIVDNVIYLNERLIYRILVFVLWLSKSASFDGLMLSIGATLFLIAKILGYLAVGIK